MKSNRGEKVRAVMLLAALISGRGQFEALYIAGHVRMLEHTAFARNDLTDFFVLGAVNIGVEWRQSRHGDVLGQ